MFSLFSHLGFPCKSIQLYYCVIVFQEFCISKLLSVFEGDISSAVTERMGFGAGEGRMGSIGCGGIIMYVHIFLLGVDTRKRSIALEIVHCICIPCCDMVVSMFPYHTIICWIELQGHVSIYWL